MKPTVQLLSLLMLCFSVRAQFTFTTNNGAITITGFAGTNRTGVIPNAINGLPVVSIGDKAFFNWFFTNSDFRSVTVPNSVTNIGYSAFSGCYGLTNATFGTNVLRIGVSAFVNCKGLTRIAIPSSVTAVEAQAFQGCSSLTNVAFADCNALVGQSSFAYCSNLASLTFSNSFTVVTNGQRGFDIVRKGVYNIGSWAFEHCRALNNVTIPASVNFIGTAPFQFCTALTSINVDATNSLFSSASGVLFDKNLITLIEFPAGRSGSYTIPSSVRIIRSFAFYGSTNLTGITIPNAITNIPDHSFHSCSSLSYVSMPDNVNSIGGYSFYGCTSLTNIFVPPSVTSILTSAFAYCTRLTSITVDPVNSIYQSLNGVLFDKTASTLIQYPGGKIGGYGIPFGVTTIAGGSFDTCVNLTSVTIPNSVTSLGSFAFRGCTGLTNLTIPDSVTNIGSAAFDSCGQMRSVTFGNNVATLGFQAFWRCTNLTSVTLGSALTSIPYTAFYKCSSLSSITIPASVAEIQSQSFAYCYGLNAVFFQGNAPAIGTDAFYGDNSVVFYYLPGTTGWSSTIGGRPAVLWNPQIQTTAATFSVQSNKFGFNITGTDNIPIAIEACTNLSHPVWQPMVTNLLTGGSYYFGDADWTNHPSRFYRIVFP